MNSFNSLFVKKIKKEKGNKWAENKHQFCYNSRKLYNSFVIHAHAAGLQILHSLTQTAQMTM